MAPGWMWPLTWTPCGSAMVGGGRRAPAPLGPWDDGHRPRPCHRAAALRHAYQYPITRPGVPDLVRDLADYDKVFGIDAEQMRPR